jgi:hypothetical protein
LRVPPVTGEEPSTSPTRFRADSDDPFQWTIVALNVTVLRSMHPIASGMASVVCAAPL